jgi:hypothetical protein
LNKAITFVQNLTTEHLKEEGDMASQILTHPSLIRNTISHLIIATSYHHKYQTSYICSNTMNYHFYYQEIINKINKFTSAKLGINAVNRLTLNTRLLQRIKQNNSFTRHCSNFIGTIITISVSLLSQLITPSRFYMNYA